MSMIKIAIMVKREFSEFYEVRHYKKHASEQLNVRQYATNGSKIVIDGEKE